MNRLVIIFYKSCKRMLMFVYALYARFFTYLKLKGNGVEFSTWISNGVPMIDIERGGRMVIGKNFCMNNGKYYNKIGRQQPTSFQVAKKAMLVIGDHVGISGSAFVCYSKIVIGNHVKIGGNCVVYDTDFHSLDMVVRRNKADDFANCVSMPVFIGDDVFIGAHSTILKGVHIGNGCIIGAGSVISKSVPEGEIWAGNPAVFIKKVPAAVQYRSKLTAVGRP